MSSLCAAQKARPSGRLSACPCLRLSAPAPVCVREGACRELQARVPSLSLPVPASVRLPPRPPVRGSGAIGAAPRRGSPARAPPGPGASRRESGDASYETCRSPERGRRPGWRPACRRLGRENGGGEPGPAAAGALSHSNHAARPARASLSGFAAACRPAVECGRRASRRLPVSGSALTAARPARA